MIKSKKQMLVIIGAFVLTLLLGTVTYAFFNYTRTGSANTIKTGRIAFNSTQGQAINLTNVFPIDVTNGIPNNNPSVGSVTINVTGDTTYTDGVEYLVSAVNVQNTVGSGANSKTLPISIDVSVASNTGNDPATALGNADESYFTNRGSSAATSIYKVLAGNTISTNDQLVVGYIKSGATGVDGNIVIRAYLDASKIAISDTYDGNETDNMGTTTNWVNDRETFTTEEWNALQTNGVSFQVKVESNEGIWVDAPPIPLPTMEEMCPGCVFKYTSNQLSYGTNGTELNVGDYDIDYMTTVANSTKPYFLGLILENGTSGKIIRAFACGIKGENPNQGTVFCIEETTDTNEEPVIFARNQNIIKSIYGEYDSNTGKGCQEFQDYSNCIGSTYAGTGEAGGDSYVYVGVNDDYDNCFINAYGTMYCG